MSGFEAIFGNISVLESELHNLSLKLEREKKNMFNEIVEISPNFTAIVQDDKFVFVNVMGRSLLKCHFSKDIIDECVSKFVDAESWVALNSRLNNRSESTKEPLQIKMQALDGCSIYFELSVEPFFYNDKNAVLIVGRDITQEMISKRNLQEAEQKYREIFDNSTESLFLLEVLDESTFRTIDINSKFISELGINKMEYLERSIDDIVSRATALKLNDVLRQCVNSRAKLDAEINLNLETGLRSFNVKLVPIFDSFGDVCRISGAAQDITDRKIDKQQLEILGRVLSNAPYAVFINEGMHRQRFSYVNNEACRSLGYDREELLRMSVYDIDPTITAEVLGQVQRGAITSGTKTFETKHKTKSGEIFPVEVSLSYYNIDDVYYGVSQVRNITEIKLKQKKIEETTKKLIESEQRYREIFTHSHDSICLLEVLGDSRFRFLEVNAEYERSIGIKSESFVGRTVDENARPDIASVVNSKYQYCVDRGEAVREIVELDLSVGKRSYDAHMIPIRDASGKVYRLLAVSRDITDELATKHELEKSRGLLENAEVLASMGHYYNDSRRKKICCSKGASTILGLKSGDELNENVDVFRFIHPDDVVRIEEKWKFAFENKITFDEVYRIVNLNGEEKVIHNVGGFVNSSTCDDMFLGSIHDITNLHFLRREVSIQAEQMKILTENSPLGIFIAKGETPVYMNRAVLDLLGLSSEDEFKAINPYDYVHPDDINSLEQLIRNLLKCSAEIPESYQLTIRSKEVFGKIKVFDLRFVVCVMDGNTYLQITVIDITDEIEKEKLLGRLAADSLYVNQRNDTISNIKYELDKVLETKGYKTNDFRKILSMLKSYGSHKADWGLFNEYFENLHPCFISNLKMLCPELTLNDIKHCACIRLNFDTKEIARFFNVEPASIQTARVRLKKKLNLPECVDLRELIQNI